MALNKVQDYISKGRLSECVDYLIKEIGSRIKKGTYVDAEGVLNDLFVLSGKIARIERDLLMGIIEYDHGELHKARVSMGLLELAGRIYKKKELSLDANYTEDNYKLITIYFNNLIGKLVGTVTNISVSVDEGEFPISLSISTATAKTMISVIERILNEEQGRALEPSHYALLNQHLLKTLANSTFSGSEMKVLDLLNNEKTVPEIAFLLETTPDTIRFYNLNILKKFRALFPKDNNFHTAKDIAKYLKRKNLGI